MRLKIVCPTQILDIFEVFGVKCSSKNRFFFERTVTPNISCQNIPLRFVSAFEGLNHDFFVFSHDRAEIVGLVAHLKSGVVQGGFAKKTYFWVKGLGHSSILGPNMLF